MFPFPNNLLIGTNAAIANDPFWSSTILLCGCEGTGDGTTEISVTDESFAAHPAGIAGGSGAVDTSYDTATRVFGTSSLYFDTGFNDYIRFSDSADWTLGTSDFTLEFFWRNETASALTPPGRTMDFISHWNATGNQKGWDLEYNGSVTPQTLTFFGSSDGATNTIIASGNWTPSNLTWYYICVERSGNTFRIYTGTPGGSTTMLAKATNTISLFDSSAPLQLSSNAATEAQCINGWMDEIRITKVARYNTDSGYPVPTAAFPRS